MSATGTAARLPDSAAFLAEEMVHDNDIAGDQRGHQNLLDISAKACAIDRPVYDAGRIESVRRSAARNVRIRHLPKGALAMRRSPLAQRPWVRVMLVFAQVSSMKTRRVGSTAA